jgi:hypothetical protein
MLILLAVGCWLLACEFSSLREDIFHLSSFVVQVQVRQEDPIVVGSKWSNISQDDVDRPTDVDDDLM